MKNYEKFAKNFAELVKKVNFQTNFRKYLKKIHLKFPKNNSNLFSKFNLNFFSFFEVSSQLLQHFVDKICCKMVQYLFKTLT